MSWHKDFKGEIRFNQSLSRYTTFRIGGPAKIFVEPKDLDDLKFLLELAKKDKINILVIGNGSNLLVSDKGVEAMVVRLSAAYFRKLRRIGSVLEAGAGVSLSQLVRKASALNLKGAEFLAGIPGTLGAAVLMNAGTKDRSIAEVVKDVRVIDYDGRVKVIEKNKIDFQYRSSGLSRYIILGIRLKLTKGDKKEIRQTIKKYLNYRWATQDFKFPNAGCIFRNPPRLSAGRLIDACELKGKHFGDAQVSLKHANFIVNRGKAKASEVIYLMSYIKRKIRQKFNISLKPEIKIWKN